jgi:channel protein (hemolysin III family)
VPFLLIGLAQARLWSNTAFRRRVFTAEFAILAAVEPHPSIPIAAIQGFSDPFSSITHLLGAGFFLVLGIVLLIRQRVGLGEAIAVLIFVLGVVFMLTMSGVFHLLTPGTASRAVLQRLDHASIFFLIAATFTPVHVIQFRGPLRWVILAFIWSAAVTGIILKSIYFNDLPEWVGLTLYLGLGWVGAISGYFLYRRFGFERVRLILLGAIAYTIGAVLEFSRFPVLVPTVVGPHELFHVMVLVGIAAHWIYIHRLANVKTVSSSGRTIPANKHRQGWHRNTRRIQSVARNIC